MPPGAPLVVVIEDEDDLRRLVEFNLGAEGFEVIGAATAGEGIALSTMHRPDVVVVDRMLHDRDGLACCEHLRGDRDLRETGILVLSARGSDGDVAAGMAAGADDYVVKPFAVADLVARVRRVAAKAAARGVRRRRAAPVVG